jgi:hypothetical protein
MKLLALVDAPDHVCTRYRVGVFAGALGRAGWDLTLQSIARGPAGRLAQLSRAGRFDSVLLQRKLLPRWQVRILRGYARRLIFDFDDAVLYRDSYDLRGPHCPRRAARFRETVGLCDVVIAGNPFLAECARGAGARPERVGVIPTCIAMERYPSSAPPEAGPKTGLDLVWIGSSSTLQGLERRRPLWDRIAREVPGVRLRLICDRFPDLGAMPVVAVPWSEVTEAESLGAGDVGVSWIPDDLWSRGKCGLKVLQYQASGLPVLANPVGVHPALIAHGVTGRLADTPESWIEGVRAFAADPAGRRLMGERARDQVVSKYSVAAWEGAFVAAIGGGPTDRLLHDGRRWHGSTPGRRDRQVVRHQGDGGGTTS